MSSSSADAGVNASQSDKHNEIQRVPFSGFIAATLAVIGSTRWCAQIFVGACCQTARCTFKVNNYICVMIKKEIR